ncbi:MAG: hypothetical protein K6F53_04555 [Lachnospiraceae bacterium]|nr:hypothetical protein [Lachnospiraceae bacterium]
MRMTNKIMQNNSLYNINQNKVLQDKLSTQMSTQKKLTRPSDDPVVAIRALRLRSSVSELTQYNDKNAADADNWLKVTSDGLAVMNDILTDMMKESNKAANKDLTPNELDIILTQVKSYMDEFYSTGNSDYAGRYLFTGYRTDTPMTFTTADVSKMTEDDNFPSYEITEQTKIDAFDTMNYTYIDKLEGLNPNNYTDGTHDTTEQKIENGDIKRLRLAYDDIKDGQTLKVELYSKSGSPLTYSDPALHSVTATAVSLGNDPYKQILDSNPGGNLVIYVPETGEILFSDGAFKTLNDTYQAAAQGTEGDDTVDPPIAGTPGVGEENMEIRVTYTKDHWNNGDLRPEHYFKCSATAKDASGTENTIDYNSEYTDAEIGIKRQTISYDVGYNQIIEVNSTAQEIFPHDLKRDLDDLQNIMTKMKDIYAIRTDLKDALRDMEESDADYADTVKQMDAANKAYDYIRENIHTAFEHMISKTQEYQADVNVAVTDNGTRSSRLALIKNRLVEQKTSFRELQDKNEGVDIAEVAIELKSAELTYESSLMATSKIMQTTLMNYI